MSQSSRIEVALLADQLERSLYGGAWHGPAVLEALAEVDGAAATRRVLEGSHTIAEIVDHVRFWLTTARRRLEGDRTEEAGDWEGAAPEGEGAWRGAVEALERAHRELRSTLEALDDARLDAAVAGSDPTARGLLLGLVQHNAYHAGQLVLLARAARGDTT